MANNGDEVLSQDPTLELAGWAPCDRERPSALPLLEPEADFGGLSGALPEQGQTTKRRGRAMRPRAPVATPGAVARVTV